MKGSAQVFLLGDVAAVGAGNSAPQEDSLFTSGSHPFVRTSDVGRVRFGTLDAASDYLNDRGIKGLRRVPKGTILFPKSGASTFLNHRVQMGMDGYVASHLATIEADPTKVEPRFLLYFLATVRTQTLVQDQNYPSLNLPTIKGISVPVPSLPEQRRIVAILDEAFEGIAAAKANAEQNLQNAREIADSATQLFLAIASSDAVATTIGDEVDLLAGFAFKSQGYTASEDGVRLLRGDNIVPGGLRWEDVKRWPTAKASDYSRYALAEDDIVLAMDRPLVSAGLKRSRITKNDLPCLLVQRVARLRSKPGLDGGFLYHILGTRRFVSYLLDGQTGTGVPHISGKQIADHAFAKPSLADQRRTARKIDVLLADAGGLEEIAKGKLLALDELKASLLHQAFTGAL